MHCRAKAPRRKQPRSQVALHQPAHHLQDSVTAPETKLLKRNGEFPLVLLELETSSNGPQRSTGQARTGNRVPPRKLVSTLGQLKLSNNNGNKLEQRVFGPRRWRAGLACLIPAAHPRVRCLRSPPGAALPLPCSLLCGFWPGCALRCSKLSLLRHKLHVSGWQKIGEELVRSWAASASVWHHPLPHC